MNVFKNAVNAGKRILLASVCIVTVMGLSRCGTDNMEETAADTYSVEKRKK